MFGLVCHIGADQLCHQRIADAVGRGARLIKRLHQSIVHDRQAKAGEGIFAFGFRQGIAVGWQIGPVGRGCDMHSRLMASRAPFAIC